MKGTAGLATLLASPVTQPTTTLGHPPTVFAPKSEVFSASARVGYIESAIHLDLGRSDPQKIEFKETLLT